MQLTLKSLPTVTLGVACVLYHAEAIFLTAAAGAGALTLTIPAISSATAAAALGGLGALKLGN